MVRAEAVFPVGVEPEALPTQAVRGTLRVDTSLAAPAVLYAALVDVCQGRRVRLLE